MVGGQGGTHTHTHTLTHTLTHTHTHTDLYIAAGEDSSGLAQHALQPVLIDGVSEINDSTFLEAEFLLVVTLKVKYCPCLLAWRRLGEGRGDGEGRRWGREERKNWKSREEKRQGIEIYVHLAPCCDCNSTRMKD